MSGKFCLDSNTIIFMLNGVDGAAVLKTKLKDAERFISVITRMEILSFPALTSDDEERINRFLTDFTIVPLNEEVEKNAVLIRRSKQLKIPDSIIAATALTADSILISSDPHLLNLDWPGFSVVKGL
jgi:predicted nucleic acid-binding protein